MKIKGFSLLELIIVVAILSLLLSISIPYYIKYKKNAYLASIYYSFTNCARSLALDYSWNSTVKSKICNFQYTTDTCEIYIDETKPDYPVRIKGNTCNISLKGFHFSCEIKSLKKVYCYEQK